MNAMPTPWLSGWSGRQGKILILGNIRSYIRAQGHREIVLSPLVVKLDDDNARSVTLGHQLAIVTAQVKKSCDMETIFKLEPFYERGPHYCGPLYKWLIFYAL